MINFRFLLSLLLLLSLNLGNKSIAQDTSSTPLIEIDLSKAKPEGISQYFTPKSCIQLEKQDTITIKRLTKVIAYADKLYTMSGLGTDAGSESIKVFDQKSGQYVQDIGREGEGPGEYYGLRDFVIDPEKNELVALVASKEALIYFNPTTGEHLKDTYTGLYATEMGLLGDQIVVYNEFNATSVSEYNFLIFLQKDGQPIARLFPYFSEQESTSLLFTGFLNPLSREALLFSKPFRDTVYIIEEDAKVEPYIHVNLGQNQINVSTMFSAALSDATFLSNTFLKTSQFIVFRYKAGQGFKLGLYDLDKDKLFVDDVQDSFFSVLTKASFYLTSFQEGEVTFVITPEYLSWSIIENPKLYESYVNDYPFLKAIFETAKVDDNPILMTFEVGHMK